MASASASSTSLPISVSKITGTACAHAAAAARLTTTVKARNLFIRCPRYHTLQYARMHPWIRRRLALALLACTPLAAEIRSLTILHTNDLHARMLPLENHHGGFAFLASVIRSEEHTSELQSPCNLVCRLLLEKKIKKKTCNFKEPIHELRAAIGHFFSWSVGKSQQEVYPRAIASTY